MSEPTYTITLTESERTALARVLGLFVAKLTSAPVFIEASDGGTQAARAVLSPPAPASPSAPPSGHVPPTPELRDRWARDRKGNELPNPEDSYPLDVLIWKTEQKEKYLRVTWPSPNGAGYGDANCFDQALWPWLIKQTGVKVHTRLYLVQKGKYTNIVGVRT